MAGKQDVTFEDREGSPGFSTSYQRSSLTIIYHQIPLQMRGTEEIIGASIGDKQVSSRLQSADTARPVCLCISEVNTADSLYETAVTVTLMLS